MRYTTFPLCLCNLVFLPEPLGFYGFYQNTARLLSLFSLRPGLVWVQQPFPDSGDNRDTTLGGSDRFLKLTVWCRHRASNQICRQIEAPFPVCPPGTNPVMSFPSGCRVGSHRCQYLTLVAIATYREWSFHCRPLILLTSLTSLLSPQPQCLELELKRNSSPQTKLPPSLWNSVENGVGLCHHHSMKDSP